MSQPPNQPPQGGFGAPQDPRQGAFGAPQPGPQTPPPPAGPPQTPPPPAVPPQAPPSPQGPPQTPAPPQGPPAGAPQPGYGYPQQQPGPYQSGPYAQQPGPYGYPQQPAAGYGYPTQPQYPGTPGGSRNPFKGKPAVAIGAAVAVLLVVGGTVFAVTRGDDGKDKPPVTHPTVDPKGSPSPSQSDGGTEGGSDPENLNGGREPGDAKVLWYKQAPDAPKAGADAPGMWITDTTAVKAAYKQVFGYRVADGTDAWDPITFPEKICSVTPQKSADDKVVVAYESGGNDSAKCNQLQQIDLNTGAKGWSISVANGALFDSTLNLELSITGKTLLAGRSQSGTAYDIATGKKLWDKKRYGDTCFPDAFAGGERLISIATCDATGSKEHDEMQELDPTTGKAKWTTRFNKGWHVARVFSVNPLVVYGTNEKKKAWNISTFDSQGKLRSEVDTDVEIGAQCGWAVLQRDLQGCSGVVVDSDTLYLPTKAIGSANDIVAISLGNGKEKWRVKSPADESMLPIKVEDGKLIAYVSASYDAAGQVVAIPLSGGSHQPATVLQHPESATDVERSFFSKAYAWKDDRFYLSSTRLNGNDAAEEKMIIAYGK